MVYWGGDPQIAPIKEGGTETRKGRRPIWGVVYEQVITEGVRDSMSHLRGKGRGEVFTCHRHP